MKKILIFGFGITGVATAKTLEKLGLRYDILDQQNIEIIRDKAKKENLNPNNLYDNIKDIDCKDYNFVLKSPGIKISNPWIEILKENKIKIISDIELVYQLWKQRKIIGITGTNGKTTTVTLVGEFLHSAGEGVCVTGNIGRGVLWDFATGSDDDIYVIECSSFQLEFTERFAPVVSGILNITPDHLDWHGSMESYIQAKCNLVRRQTTRDIAVLNWDDPLIRQNTAGFPVKKHWISLKERVYGYYCEDGFIVEDLEEKTPLISLDYIHVPGEHNLQNILMAVGIARAMGVGISDLEKTLDEFYGVEHRIEYVAEIDGVKYYNDSKGTNVDASVHAVHAFDSPLILIAGGYDKNVDLTDFFVAFEGKVKKLILMGQTAEKFKAVGKEQGFEDSVIVKSMKEAVKLAKDIAEPGDVVLLSPASASWGMYSNFEERGKDFKECVLD